MEESENLDESKLEPRLNIPDFRGSHVIEYIPTSHNKYATKIYDAYFLLRCKMNLDIYYWQLRYMYSPLDRKVKDLEFMDHVIEHHDAKPQQLIERFHFWLARMTYGHEYLLIRRLDNKDHLYSKASKDIYLQKHPYIKAYKKRWVGREKEDSQWNTLYHGVKCYELGFFIDSFEKKHKFRLRYYQRLKNKLEKDIKKD